jgi:hypothetical protein
MKVELLEHTILHCNFGFDFLLLAFLMKSASSYTTSFNSAVQGRPKSPAMFNIYRHVFSP